jgi:putative addiction module CopG family antidote
MVVNLDEDGGGMALGHGVPRQWDVYVSSPDWRSLYCGDSADSREGVREMALTIHLRDDLKRFVEREVSTGRYANEDEVIEAALEQLAEAPEPIIEPTMTVAEAVAEAMEQYRRGEGRELTDEVWAEMLRESEREAALGLPVRDEIKY